MGDKEAINSNIPFKLYFSIITVIFRPLFCIINQNFNLDFSNPKIESAREIFTEKQLQEYTSTYSVDERTNPLEFLLSFFKKGKDEEIAAAAPTAFSSKQKTTVSLAALKDKTAAYVRGKTDAASFYAVLKVAFGDKLPSVLPQIVSTLPKDKAAALSKIAK